MLHRSDNHAIESHCDTIETSDKLCSEYDCPDGFLEADGAENKVCSRRRGCTKDQCCKEDSETSVLRNLERMVVCFRICVVYCSVS